MLMAVMVVVGWGVSIALLPVNIAKLQRKHILVIWVCHIPSCKLGSTIM